VEDLRLVMLSGDWIPLSLPDRIRDVAPHGQVISLGGATEASIWSIWHPVGELDPAWPSIPYGRPLANQTFHVLDAELCPVPTWVPGELFIGGVGVARGYWGDPGKTAERFLSHPVTGERLYRTGDLGRYHPDGTIEFLGRNDHQVKINGYRIELGEIEAKLTTHPGVKDAVVTAANNHLTAYL
ncbi:AMP-binding protein, partial [Streptomyces sporangiiformans]